MILFACEVAAGIWGFVNKDQVSRRGRSGGGPTAGWGASCSQAGRKSTGAFWRRWHGAGVGAWGRDIFVGQPGKGMSSGDGHHCARDHLRPQIAKDVKQFYDQALQQAIVDDDANNAKAVVKTFHETVRGCWGKWGVRGARESLGVAKPGWGRVWPQPTPQEQDGAPTWQPHSRAVGHPPPASSAAGFCGTHGWVPSGKQVGQASRAAAQLSWREGRVRPWARSSPEGTIPALYPQPGRGSPQGAYPWPTPRSVQG